MNKIILTAVFLLFMNSCSSNAQPCDPKNNELPMYGGVQKCPELIAADEIFFQTVAKQYPDKKIAAKEMVTLAWDYLYKRDISTAMKRFNQAWMLDSLNANVYWGFASIQGYRQQFTESEILFKRAIVLDSLQSNLYVDYATTLGNLYDKTKNQDKLLECINVLDKAIALDENNAKAYFQKAVCFYYLDDMANAKKMLVMTEKINPEVVDASFKALLYKP